jgi:hypothetical protein
MALDINMLIWLSNSSTACNIPFGHVTISVGDDVGVVDGAFDGACVV